MIVITLARKPTVGATVRNILQHGTGGLNIKGCRLSPSNKGAESAQNVEKAGPLGRFPANVFLTHLTGCRQVGVHLEVRDVLYCDIERKSGVSLKGSVDGSLASGRKVGETVNANSIWECETGCPALDLNTQSLETGSTVKKSYSEHPRTSSDSGELGGAARFFPQFKDSP